MTCAALAPFIIGNETIWISKQLEPRDRSICAVCVWREARNGGLDGMTLVAHAILNRATDKRWPNSIADVCLQKFQFSCFNPNDPQVTKYPDERSWRDGEQAIDDALAARADGLPDPIDGANHYMTETLYESDKRPSWANFGAETFRGFGHVFLRL
jgi:hypothetical protein